MIPTFEEVQKVSGNISSPMLLQPWEAELFYDTMAKTPAGGVVVEVGAHHGRSSSITLQLAKAIGFHSFHVDPYCDNDGDGNGVENIAAAWVKLMKTIDYPFTLFCMKTEQVGPWLPDVLDAGYIDGEHSAAAMTIDLATVADRIKPGGYLLTHDFGPSPIYPHGPLGERFPEMASVIRDYVAQGWEHIGMAESLAVWRRK